MTPIRDIFVKETRRKPLAFAVDAGRVRQAMEFEWAFFRFLFEVKR
jgi:hypothetical protein